MSNKLRRLVSIIGIIVGILIMYMAYNIYPYSDNYVPEQPVGSYITFGADFYTEIYDVTRDVGEAVNNVGDAVSNVSYRINDLHYTLRILIFALGAIDVCFFLYTLCTPTQCAPTQCDPVQEKPIKYHCPKCNRDVSYGTPMCECGQTFDWDKI